MRIFQLVTNKQQADTGTKMVHLGKNTKTLSSQKVFLVILMETTGLVELLKATNSRNFQCDSLLMGENVGHTFPYIEVKNNSSQ